MKNRRSAITSIALCAGALLLSGCNSSFHDLGRPPVISQVGYETPLHDVLVPPEPAIIHAPSRLAMEDNSLWNGAESVFFKDTRAFEVGDILTVDIAINEGAKLKNTSGRVSEVGGSVGGDLDGFIGKIDVGRADFSGNLNGNLELERGGTVDRTERINLRVAAVVTQASANGNLRITGSQEVRVNHEIRILRVDGVVRTKDINPDNTIPYEKIAEARISYGGHNTRRPGTVQKHWNPLRQSSLVKQPILVKK